MTNSDSKREKAFPLPQGHYFGPDHGDLRSHSGDLYRDQVHLWHWQDHYRRHRDADMPVTGLYSGPTQRAALDLQRAAGLPLTGCVDQSTWEALYGATKAPESPTEAPGAPVWYPGEAFGSGDTGTHVTKVQIALGQKASGTFNPALSTRVKGLQRVLDLPVTGRVDAATARAIDAKLSPEKKTSA